MAVQVEHLGKTFQIPHERRTTLFENLVGLMKPKRYEAFIILKDVSFDVDKGECIGIVEDNGSGKSTLLKVIANILRPSKGTIRVEGKMTPFLELGVGFQPDLTVQENVGVYATIMRLSKKEIKEDTDEVIEFAGLKNFEDMKLKNLSTGMQVRLVFSTAVRTNPDVLLVDEVLAVGDMEFQQKCFDVFNNYKKEGVTILLVSHDPGAMRRFCDKTLMLRNGEREFFGDTNEEIDQYIYKLKENEASHDQKEIETKPRWDNGKIGILSLKFIDKNSKNSDNFVSGDPFVVSISYETHETVFSPVFGTIFYCQDIYCYGTTTDFKGCDTGLVSGRDYVDFIVNRLPLIAGKFDVAVAVAPSDYKTQYDWHDRLYSFKVHNPTLDLGMFSIEGSRRISKHG